MNDSFLFEASSIFLAAWALTIAALCVATFGRDLVTSKASPDSSKATVVPRRANSRVPY